MPASVVKTSRDEKIWRYKVAQVAKMRGKSKKSFGDKDWALVMTLFKRAKEKYEGTRLPAKYNSLASFLSRLEMSIATI